MCKCILTNYYRLDNQILYTVFYDKVGYKMHCYDMITKRDRILHESANDNRYYAVMSTYDDLISMSVYERDEPNDARYTYSIRGVGVISKEDLLDCRLENMCLNKWK